MHWNVYTLLWRAIFHFPVCVSRRVSRVSCWLSIKMGFRKIRKTKKRSSVKPCKAKTRCNRKVSVPSPKSAMVDVVRPEFRHAKDHSIPEDLEGAPVFDTHCHLDRWFLRKHATVPLDPLGDLASKYPSAFGSTFRGCISNCCDPMNWSVSKN